jgi:hypothetical protein
VTTPTPRKRSRRPRGGRKDAAAPPAAAPVPAAPAAPAKSRAKAKAAPATGRAPRHTSQSTTRAAYAETRRWLLAEHGPVCAYCAQRYPEREMTLDHVSPRRGQDAYDRRDNLVLACKACNSAKADMPIMAFLLRRRERAVSLAQYGVHLSPMLREMALQIADGVVDRHAAAPPPAGADSPYADVAYREPLRPYRDVTHEGLPPAMPDPEESAEERARRPRRRGERRANPARRCADRVLTRRAVARPVHSGACGVCA